ncbi:hypothetical protein [Limnothrix redekei]|uniref:Uncharacterized protein n=1 Tax=Limnothrix redekei LRLZ20PSL1 TaxID=3112953 RepID=A0ABW7C5L8_9CYAN
MNAPSKAGRWLAGTVLTLLLVVGGCVALNDRSDRGPAPSPTPTTVVDRSVDQSTDRSSDRQSPKPSPSVSPSPIDKKPVAGGKLNKYFPKTSDGYSLVFQQEKKGFAEAKLKKSGEEVAKLSINDLANNASGLSKFQNSDDDIDGYPAVQVGKNQTAVLVGDRYQVKVQSTTLKTSDREDWIEKFNLSGLARLK